MFELQRLRLDHQVAVLEFELANRSYFVESISDRGDDYFLEFAERHRATLEEHEGGQSAYYVLVVDDFSVVGRFNLYKLFDRTAEVGYRVAKEVAGRGAATSGLKTLCRIATEELGLRALKASVSHENVASQRVLKHAGFEYVGPAEVGGREGMLYELILTVH
jgi:ribosomal-protein-alanine N-acetyltransferase